MKIPMFFGALLAPVWVLAQTSSAVDSDPVVLKARLPSVVVTATRTPLPAREALAAVTVIGRDQIERAQATDIAEILRFEAGLELGRTGGLGQQSAIFIRGGESNHTLVLIDGVRVNPATSGGAALQNIAPEMIERIEIVRGPRATLYGSDAIGGVINIITRSPQQSLISAVARGGSDNLRDVAAHLGYGDADKRLSLQVQRLITDGAPVCAGGTLDRGYDNTSFNLRGSTRVGEGAELAARLWNAAGNVEYTDFCGDGGGPRSQDFQNQTAALDLRLQPTNAWSTTLTASRGEDDIRQLQANFLGELDQVRTVRPMLDWHNVVQAGVAHRLSFGGSVAREEVTARSFGTLIDERRDIHALFVQDEISLGRHRVVLALNQSDYEGFGDQTNWNVEYGFDLFAATRLIAAAGTGFRAPDASDRFGFGGNPDLEPEESTNYELGLRQSVGQRQIVDLRLFQSEVDALITVACDADFNCLAVNLDEYRNRGAELSWRYNGEAWRASVSGIVQEPEDRSTGDILPRRAKRSVTMRLARYFGPHHLGLDVLGSGERPDVGTLVNAGYALVNLTAGAQLLPKLRLQARAENLLDKDYQTAAGYTQPGASVFVTLAYAL